MAIEPSPPSSPPSTPTEICLGEMSCRVCPMLSHRQTHGRLSQTRARLRGTLNTLHRPRLNNQPDETLAVTPHVTGIQYQAHPNWRYLLPSHQYSGAHPHARIEVRLPDISYDSETTPGSLILHSSNSTCKTTYHYTYTPCLFSFQHLVGAWDMESAK